MIQWFSWQHLPSHLQAVAAPLRCLAEEIDAAIPDSPEKTAGMRKLLEAKDCFVRAAIEAKAVKQGVQKSAG